MAQLLARLPPWRFFLADPIPFLSSWVLGGFIAIIVPVLKWKNNRQDWYSYYGRANEYEQQQRAYEEAQNGNNNNNNYYYRDCRWFQWRCRRNQFYYRQMNGSGDNNGVQVPDWYIFLGGKTEEDRRMREEMNDDSESGAVKFVYYWSLLMFIGILVYGFVAVTKKHNFSGLLVTMLLFAQFCLMSMLLLAQGVISTEGREMEDSVYGWYGQMAVLMVYSDFWYLLFCVVFSVVLAVREVILRRMNKNAPEPSTDDEANHYYTAPDMKITPA